ncbi:MAG: peptidase G2 autoproteolytic cleavage domain-containing protein, partial [Bacteroidota bacterium]
AIGDHGKIHPAQEGEIPIGIISANPLIAGNNPPEWPGKYLRNEWGQFIVETYEDEAAESGKKVEKQRLQLNPEYDPDREYVLRSQREEWCCVGLLGQLPLRKRQPVAPGWIKLHEISVKADMWLVK